jgi:hypothetical protein
MDGLAVKSVLSIQKKRIVEDIAVTNEESSVKKTIHKIKI